MFPDMQAEVSEQLSDQREVRWSVCLRDRRGSEIASEHADRVLSTASVGKLFLLVEIARRCESGSLGGSELLAKDPGLAVTDSGIWQHLQAAELCVEDLATLVGSVSDNLATNVLLARVGLRQVRAAATALGMEHSYLLDRVREHRDVGDPPRLSEGSAGELSRLMADVGSGTLVSSGVSARLDRWLSAGVDLSMVAAPFNLDPLAHVDEARGLVLRNKTGTDAGVRADVGHVRGPKESISYAVLANWDSGSGDHRDEVLATMRAIGASMVRLVC